MLSTTLSSRVTAENLTDPSLSSTFSVMRTAVGLPSLTHSTTSPASTSLASSLSHSSHSPEWFLLIILVAANPAPTDPAIPAATPAPILILSAVVNLPTTFLSASDSESNFHTLYPASWSPSKFSLSSSLV